MGAPGRTVVPQESTRLGSRSYYTHPPMCVAGPSLSLPVLCLVKEMQKERKLVSMTTRERKKRVKD